jgi:hypothetical protein
MKKHADELIKALEDFLELAPDGAALRLYVGDKLDDAPMPPEEFVAFARKLLVVARKIRKKYE